MAAESALKTVFDNLRNLLNGGSIIMLATAACRFHQHLGLAWWLAVVLAALLIILTVCLLVGNAISGFQTLHNDRRWLHLGSLAGIYLSIIILLAHAVPAVGFK